MDIIKHISELESKVLFNIKYPSKEFKIKERKQKVVVLQCFGLQIAIFPSSLVRSVNDTNGNWKIKQEELCRCVKEPMWLLGGRCVTCNLKQK